MLYLLIALAPVFIILIYIYVRDKYEKEPISLLLKSLFFGALIVLPVIYIETSLTAIATFSTRVSAAFYEAFIVAAITEEVFKFGVLYWLIKKSPEFNERFDGIVYAVFISLGFAGIENILYIFDSGLYTGIVRAFTAVPAHAFFGVSMGYYFALSKFKTESTRLNLIKALLIPILLHGIYDFILMVGNPITILFFIPFLIYLWINGFKKIKNGSVKSRKI